MSVTAARRRRALGGASDVPETPRQAKIAALRAEEDELLALQRAGGIEARLKEIRAAVLMHLRARDEEYGLGQP